MERNITLTIAEFLKCYWQDLVGILAMCGVVIEITPIKLSPLRWLGNRLNADIKEDVNQLKYDLKKHVSDSEKKEMKNLRKQILEFSDNLTEGKKPSKDAFLNIFESIQEYHSIIDKYNLTNGVIDLEVDNIRKHYRIIYLHEK